MEWLMNPELWVAFLTLTALEIVLGIDNIIFISILVGRLPPSLLKRHLMAPVRDEAKALHLAVNDPSDQVGIEKSMYVSLCRVHWEEQTGRWPVAKKRAVKKTSSRTAAKATLRIAAASRSRPPKRSPARPPAGQRSR